MSIQQHEVPSLLAGPQGTVGSLVGRLRQLQVLVLDREDLSKLSTTSTGSSSSWEEQVGAVGRLLAQCTGVQALSLYGGALSEQDQQLQEAALVAGTTSRTPAVGSSSIEDVQLSSSSSSSGEATAAAGGGGSSSVRAEGATACLPLRELELTSLPLSVCGTWLQQWGQLEQLRSLTITSWDRSDFKQSKGGFKGWLTSLVGLQKLTLEHLGSPHDDAAPRGLPAALTALTSSLTQLSVHKFGLEGRQAQGLSRLTALQRLELVECQGEQELSSKWLTLLQQLTYLNLSGSPVKQLPKNLGQALPHLQVLLVANTWCGELPKGMTRLTRLDASMESSSELSDASLAAVCEATALRQLNLSGCGIKYASCLSALSALEVLQMQGSGSRGWEDDCDEDKSSSSTPPGDRLRWMCRLHDHLDYGTESGSDYDSYSSSSRRSLLPPTLPLLVNLRRLDLHNSEWWVSDLVTMGGFQHLTFLDLSSGLAREGGESGAGGLPVLGVLPALQQLDLSCVGVDGHQWPAVGAWLGRQPQLTRLSLSLSAQLDRPRDAQQQAAGLALLPTQLVELDLSHCELQQLPPRLSQMTNLKILLAGSNPGLPPQLPAWLPEVQQLEVVQVHDVGEGCMQLLRQLPRLRTFDSTEYEAYMALQPDLRRELPHLLASSYCPRLFPEAPV